MTDPPPDHEFARLSETWTRLGESDPYWAVLSDPAMRGGGWEDQLDAFMASGEDEVATLAGRLADLGLDPDAPALDFGCGVGRVTRALGKSLGGAHGVDISLPMIERARTRGDVGCTYHHNAATDLGLFPDDRFGLVYSRLVFQHMPPKLGEAFLGELLRVARPGAPVVIQIPAARRGFRRLTAPLIQGSRRLIGRGGRTAGIEMHGIGRDRVARVVREAGGEVADVSPDDSAGPDWESWSYVFTG